MLYAVLLDPLPIGLQGGCLGGDREMRAAALEQTVAVKQKQSVDICGPI
jgi:hypothetical protein